MKNKTIDWRECRCLCHNGEHEDLCLNCHCINKGKPPLNVERLNQILKNK